jgi:hypothetical protein
MVPYADFNLLVFPDKVLPSLCDTPYPPLFCFSAYCSPRCYSSMLVTLFFYRFLHHQPKLRPGLKLVSNPTLIPQ